VSLQYQSVFGKGGTALKRRPCRRARDLGRCSAAAEAGATWHVPPGLGWTFIVLKRALDRLNTAQGPEQFAAGLKRAKVLTLAELAFFAVIFTCMILMRFGL
jgi:hypothetical protein